MFLVVGTQSRKCAHPKFAFLVDVAAVHLVVGQGCIVRSVFAPEIMQFAGFPVIAPKPFALGRQPQVAFAVFIDVDGDGIRLAYTFKPIFFVIIQAQALHRTHPHLAMRILIDGIRTGIVKTCRVIGLHILSQLSCLQIHHHHAIGISAYPEFVVIAYAQGMDIEF